MNIKCIAYLAIASNYINSAIGVNKQTISRCNSAPDLRALYNSTSYNMNNIISCDQYKSNIYNRYKRNMYLRSKEKYSFDAKK
jgi:hypothetical protein